MNSETPAALGYRMPAEWEPHAATWIVWPHNRDDWPGRFAPIPWVYVEIVRQLSRYEPVHILVNSNKLERQASDRLDRAGVDLNRVRFFKIRTDRGWVRDSGPSFVVNDQAAEPSERVAMIDWRFNGWAKYENHQRDNRLPRKLSCLLAMKRWKPSVAVGDRRVRVVLEGGAIDVNGQGTLLTTEECLLSAEQARNPDLDRPAIERVLADYLGVRHVVWLGRGIVGDDTHGHVDDITRFVDPTTVVTSIAMHPDDENYEPLHENFRLLLSATDQDGRPLNVVELPLPEALSFEGQRLPASYANFYIANGVVLVPTFNDPSDRRALNILASVFPHHEIIGIHAVDLVWGLGTLHCLTHEQPS